jgi:hypothetical protein
MFAFRRVGGREKLLPSTIFELPLQTCVQICDTQDPSWHRKARCPFSQHREWRPGPHPSFIQVAKPYVFEQKLQECMTAIGVNEAKRIMSDSRSDLDRQREESATTVGPQVARIEWLNTDEPSDQCAPTIQPSYTTISFGWSMPTTSTASS